MKIREAKKKDWPKLRKLFLESQKYEASFDEELVVNQNTETNVL